MDECKVNEKRDLALAELARHVKQAMKLMAINEGELWINALYELQQAKEISDNLAEYDTQQLNLPLQEEKNNG